MQKEFKLAPSILSADFSMLKEQIHKVELSGAHYLHLDVMDGNFVPNLTFGPIVIKGIRKMTDMTLDAHLMIEKPERYIKEFAAAGADIITIHSEATNDIDACLNLIRQCGKKTGLSIKPNTSIDSIIRFLPKTDMLLIMTVEPGFGGQSYISEMTEKVIEASKIFKGDIEVDGGISLANVKSVYEAGANVVVAGSAVFGSADIEKTVKDFYSAVKV